MGLAATSDLALYLRPPSASPAARTVAGLLREATAAGEAGRVARLEEYVQDLEEERRKIEGFRRELPLCMLILSDVLDGLKAELARLRGAGAGGCPTLEEFMPVRRNSDDVEVGMKEEDDERDKVNWMSSAQLWSDNHSANTSTTSNTTAATNHVGSSGNSKKNSREETDDDDRRIHSDESPFADSNCRHRVEAFLPFRGLAGCPSGGSRKEKVTAAAAAVPLPDVSFLTPATKPSRVWASLRDGGRGVVSPVVANAQASVQAQSQLPRKTRRCWSPELHRRFVNALQQLGGAQAATPKQIRELMKVDGLTNDEVKSHLQKYRLHTRRTTDSSNPADQPVIMLGGLWLSHEDYPPTKESTSQSGSPNSPLQLASAPRGASVVMGGDNCVEEEEEEDGKSECYSWRGHVRRSSGEETD